MVPSRKVRRETRKLQLLSSELTKPNLIKIFATLAEVGSWYPSPTLLALHIEMGRMGRYFSWSSSHRAVTEPLRAPHLLRKIPWKHRAENPSSRLLPFMR
ncbi:hypothetical protein I7I50_01030 [Histoplasma capsulatum G186AR]|uniref:Uncharacterized protein n=1 Tax=Ajellomyces capsulatus TaxID=5037 RepID=A0A8H7YGK2_AJECA|nr:hypothetical protein I7I52_08296 [Histoplasma capsulatum]QSS73010.1 hypothetical protein I7I50_01030 [Histoplasma capsulatum G186AR]